MGGLLRHLRSRDDRRGREAAADSPEMEQQAAAGSDGARSPGCRSIVTGPGTCHVFVTPPLSNKKRILEIRCGGMIMGAFQPPRVNWVIRLTSPHLP